MGIIVKKIKRKIRKISSSLLLLPTQYKLLRTKLDQRKSFAELSLTFQDKYKKVKEGDIEKFVTPLWKSFNTELEKFLLPLPAFNFLQDKTISSTMFINSGGKLMKNELVFLKNYFSDDLLNKILSEDPVGIPSLADKQYATSHNTIHQAYHLARFLNSTNTDIKNIYSVVEWGGGYGNFAKIFRKFNSSATYVMIDTPLLSCLQWLYLSTIFGQNEVNFVADPGDRLKTGKINILPLTLIENFDLKANLFVSTWALSESSSYAQQYVHNKNWFGANHILLAYQDSNPDLPDASNIKKFAIQTKAKLEEIPDIKNSHYLFL